MRCLVVFCLVVVGLLGMQAYSVNDCVDSVWKVTQSCDNMDKLYVPILGPPSGELSHEFSTYLVNAMLVAMLQNRRLVYLVSHRKWPHDCEQQFGWACYLTFSSPSSSGCNDAIAYSTSEIDLSRPPDEDGTLQRPGSSLLADGRDLSYVLRQLIPEVNDRMHRVLNVHNSRTQALMDQLQSREGTATPRGKRVRVKKSNLSWIFNIWRSRKPYQKEYVRSDDQSKRIVDQKQQIIPDEIISSCLNASDRITWVPAFIAGKLLSSMNNETREEIQKFMSSFQMAPTFTGLSASSPYFAVHLEGEHLLHDRWSSPDAKNAKPLEIRRTALRIHSIMNQHWQEFAASSPRVVYISTGNCSAANAFARHLLLFNSGSSANTFKLSMLVNQTLHFIGSCFNPSALFPTTFTAPSFIGSNPRLRGTSIASQAIHTQSAIQIMADIHMMAQSTIFAGSFHSDTVRMVFYLRLARFLEALETQWPLKEIISDHSSHQNEMIATKSFNLALGNSDHFDVAANFDL